MDTLYKLEDLKKYDNLELLAKKVVEGYIVGLHKSPLHGFSAEFAQHRQYNPGNDIKHVDWKVFARTDKMFIKEYEEETNLRCQIVIDASSSMFFPKKDHNKLMFATYASAALMHVLKKQRDAVGLTIFNESIQEHTEAKSSPKHHRYLSSLLHQVLNTEQEKMKTNISDCLHMVAERIHKRSLVIIFSDMFNNMADKEALFSALQHLKHNKNEIIIFHTMDHKLEMDLELKNRPYKMVDMETGEQVKIFPNEVRDFYTKNIKAFEEELRMTCGAYKVDFVPIDINQPFAEVLIPYFLKRSKMP
jgi:uncharacterized protein (DUF58 family)